MIGGTMGVGKSTVCEKLKQELPQSVFLDGDWCWDGNPFQVTEETKAMVIKNSCYMLNNLIKSTAYENVIFGWVMHEQKIIHRILNKLDLESIEAKSIYLMANEETIKERLSRDIASVTRSEDVIERSLRRL